MSTIGTYVVREMFLTTVPTSQQMGGFKGMVSSLAVAAAPRMLSLWKWGHDYYLRICKVAPAPWAGFQIIAGLRVVSR